MVTNSYMVNGNGAINHNNGYSSVTRHTYPPLLPPMRGSSLPCLDIRVFYVRVCKCRLNKSTPEVLTLNIIPLHPDTLLEVNGVRGNLYSGDWVPTLLRRDRVDRKSEEVTFVSTDSTKMSGSVRFEVFDRDVLMLSGVLELCNSNGFLEDQPSQDNNGQGWSMKCESDIVPGTSFFKGKRNSTLPTIEVYIAGSFLSNPIILTKTLGIRRKQSRAGTMAVSREHDASDNGEDTTSALAFQASDSICNRTEYEENHRLYQRTAYLEDENSNILHHRTAYLEDENSNILHQRTAYLDGEEDGEMSWFNAGVRVGVGIGLGVCLGIGIGVGVIVKTYQSVGNFTRRLL